MTAAMRNPRRRLDPATTFLIRAFAPGCPTMLRSWSSKRVTVDRDRLDQLTIFFDLPDDRAFRRGLELERSAGAMRLVRVGKRVVRELTVDVSGPHRTLKVEALIGTDVEWGEER